MADLSVIFEKVRMRIREKDTQFFDDDDLISMANDQLDTFADALIGHECKVMMGELSTSVISGTSEYTISEKKSIIPGNVFIDNTKVSPFDSTISERLSFLETNSGIVFYNLTGDEILVRYWSSVTELTSTEDSVPWEGIWDKALMRAMVAECKDIRKHDARNAAALASTAYSLAVSQTLAKYGRIRRYMRGSLNV